VILHHLVTFFVNDFNSYTSRRLRVTSQQGILCVLKYESLTRVNLLPNFAYHAPTPVKICSILHYLKVSNTASLDASYIQKYVSSSKRYLKLIFLRVVIPLLDKSESDMWDGVPQSGSWPGYFAYQEHDLQTATNNLQESPHTCVQRN